MIHCIQTFKLTYPFHIRISLVNLCDNLEDILKTKQHNTAEIGRSIERGKKIRVTEAEHGEDAHRRCANSSLNRQAFGKYLCLTVEYSGDYISLNFKINKLIFR